MHCNKHSIFLKNLSPISDRKHVFYVNSELFKSTIKFVYPELLLFYKTFKEMNTDMEKKQNNSHPRSNTCTHNPTQQQQEEENIP